MSQQRKKKKKPTTKPGKQVSSTAEKGQQDHKNKAKKEESKPSPRLVAADRIKRQQKKERRKLALYRSLIAVAFLLAVGVIGYAVYSSQADDDLPNMNAKPTTNDYAIPKGANKDGIIVGNADAPVKVDIYLDFLCPHCADFEKAAEEDLGKRVAEGKAQIAYHPIAILSGYSVWSSAAAGCAADEGKFPEYTQALFERQGELRPEKLADIGKEVGLNSQEFRTCVVDQKYQNWVLGLKDSARRLGIQGTPTIFVDGKEIVPEGKISSFVKKIVKTIDEKAKQATKG